jgi:hypothetical protein
MSELLQFFDHVEELLGVGVGLALDVSIALHH